MRAIAVVVLMLLAWAAAAEVLTPEEARARALAGALTIVDVRRPAEWADWAARGAAAVSLQDPKP